MTSYLVPWRSIVSKYMDLEEFCRITQDLIYNRARKLPDALVFSDPKGKRRIPAETERLYDKCLYLMGYCGYGMDGIIVRHYGWYNAYLDGEVVRFHRTAPDPMREISYGTFVEFRKGQEGEEKQEQDEKGGWES